jgi:transcriptional antiterminator NusG
MSEEQVFCVFCETGREAKVQEALCKLGFRIIPAVAKRAVFKRKKETMELRPLVPGYVFFQYDCEPEWKQVCRLKYVYYTLKYSDNSKALRGKDLEFVRWIMRRGSALEISKAVRVGTKVKIIDGPLKEWEGNIIKLNSRAKCAEVKIDTEGIIHTVWLSFEVINVIEKEI